MATTADSCPDLSKLNAVARGTLVGPDAQAIERHLASCLKCQAAVGTLSADLPTSPNVTPPKGPFGNGIPPSGSGNGGSGSGRAAGGAKYPFLAPPVEPGEIGRIGNYRVLNLVGKGGMAYVFHAEDIALRRPVALKVMDPSLGGDLEAWQRFLREAQIMARIKHQHLVTVYQVGQEGAATFIAMELLEGEPLENRLNRFGVADPAEILRLAREITSGLDVIHRNGLIHRDIKPANIWLEAPGSRVKILDFGLARYVEDDAHLTQSGTVMGTPAYMSPEQARGQKVDVRSDLFSLGCVLYCLCTGAKPFQGANTMAILTALAVDRPKPIDEFNKAIPRPLADLVMRLLAKEPGERPASAAAVLAELAQGEDWLGATLVKPPPSSPALVAALPMPSTPSGRTQRLDSTPIPALPVAMPVKPERPWLIWALPVACAAFIIGAIGLRLLTRGDGQLPTGPGNVSTNQAVKGPGPEKGPPDNFPPDKGWPPDKGPPPDKGFPPDKGPPPDFGPPDRMGKAFQPKPAVPGQVWLTELPEAGAVNYPFSSPPPPTPWQPPQNVPPAKGGVHIRIQGTFLSHSLFMHPPVPPMPGNNKVSVSYRLGKQYRTFSTQVTLNDSGPPEAPPMIFVVYGDGTQLWKSRPVTQRELQECTASVQGVDILKLEVQYQGDQRGAHAAWVEPYVVK